MTDHGNRKSLKYNSRRSNQKSCMTTRATRKNSIDGSEPLPGCINHIPTACIKHPLNDYIRINKVRANLNEIWLKISILILINKG